MDGTTEEVVEVVDDGNVLTGRTCLRKVAHAEGVLHRTVYVMLFNSKNELLIQKRHTNKSVCGGTWDLSAAEHLNPGESYESGAIRGLQEELGITLKGHLKEIMPPTRRSLQVTTPAGKKINDQEFVPVYEGMYDGEIVPDEVEVSEVRWITEKKLLEDIESNRSAYTPWFVKTLVLMGKIGEE